MTVTVRAPAKINLHLGVGALRDDGYHPISTVYQAVGLCDDLTASTSPGWLIGLGGPPWMDLDAIPLFGDNIVDRAAQLLAAHHGLDVLGDVRIQKAIPVAGGMAGGSADAAAALVALDRLWDTHTSDEDLLALAAELGSDVPFALVGGTALGLGRGEQVTPLPDEHTWWWVAVPSSTGLPTPEVYRRFDEMFPTAPADPSPADGVIEAIGAGDPHLLAAAMHNDLQAPAFDLRPDLEDLVEHGERCGALRGMVSGSGPTCVFLCEDADHAREVVLRVDQTAYPVSLVTNGPVAGAHLVTYV